MRVLTTVLVIFLLIQSNQVFAGFIWNFIHDLVQWNIAGIPKVHVKTTWNLDPKLGEERREKYVKENGYLGKDLIARIGDGHVV